MNKQDFLNELNLIPFFGMESALQEQEEIIESATSYVSRLELNNFLDKPLLELSIEQRLALFSYLKELGFSFSENNNLAVKLGIDFLIDVINKSFEPKELFNKTFELEDLYRFDQFYIKTVLTTREMLNDEINTYENFYVHLWEILEYYVFNSSKFHLLDAPNLTLMLTVKKALLGAFVAEINIERIKNGETEVYDITPLY